MIFKNLSTKLSSLLNNLIINRRLTEDNIKSSINDVRVALLEADVALKVVDEFVKLIKNKAIGLKVSNQLTPAQAFIKIVHNSLVSIMGGQSSLLNLSVVSPIVLLIVGYQGSGKTTTVGKLGNYISKKYKKKVLLVSADVYRPAGIKQLELLSKQANVDSFLLHRLDDKPLQIVKNAFSYAKKEFYDVLLIDTAGCLHVENTIIISELIDINNKIKPTEILFVVDAMTGQDAANMAYFFNKYLPVTGIILTKIDGDARGGAAFSINRITGKPIKFIGTGEEIDALEVFYPDRLANRILGMGDVLSLIEDIETKVDSIETNKLANKLKKDGDFNLSDFLFQLRQIRNIGGCTKMMAKLPMLTCFSDKITSQINDEMFLQMEVIINSMNLEERMHPEIINGSRKRRIAHGAGVKLHDVNVLLKRFNEMKKVISTMHRGGMNKMAQFLFNKISL